VVNAGIEIYQRSKQLENELCQSKRANDELECNNKMRNGALSETIRSLEHKLMKQYGKDCNFSIAQG